MRCGGRGFSFPAGNWKPCGWPARSGLSAASSLLLVGAGSGGPPCSVASHLGVWVTGYEADATLAGARQRTQHPHRPRPPGHDRDVGPRRARFRPRLFPSRHGVRAAGGRQPRVGADRDRRRPEAGRPAHADPDRRRYSCWIRTIPWWSAGRAWNSAAPLRPPHPPPSPACSAASASMCGSSRISPTVTCNRRCSAGDVWWATWSRSKLTARQAGPLVTEAERWLLQLRLFQAGKLRRVRWHAIGRVAG